MTPRAPWERFFDEAKAPSLLRNRYILQWESMSGQSAVRILRLRNCIFVLSQMPVFKDPETSLSLEVASSLYPSPYGKKIHKISKPSIDRHMVAVPLRRFLTAKTSAKKGDQYHPQLSFEGIVQLANVGRRTAPYPEIRDGEVRLCFYLKVKGVGTPIANLRGAHACSWLNTMVLVTSTSGDYRTLYPGMHKPNKFA